METMNKKEFNNVVALLSDILELKGDYIGKFISLGVKYNRSETLELADEYVDKYNEITDKLKKANNYDN